MADKLPDDALEALKTAFTFMPQVIEVNSYDYGDRCDKVIAQVELVREVLLANGIDPDEVADEINPELANNSFF